MLFDPTSQLYLDDPYPVLRELQERAPVFWHDAMESWIVTSYNDCLAVIQAPARFTADRRKIGEDVPEVMQSVQTIDPPEHTELRRLLHHMMRAVDMTAVEHISIKWTESF